MTILRKNLILLLFLSICEVVLAQKANSHEVEFLNSLCGEWFKEYNYGTISEKWICQADTLYIALSELKLNQGYSPFKQKLLIKLEKKQFSVYVENQQNNTQKKFDIQKITSNAMKLYHCQKDDWESLSYRLKKKQLKITQKGNADGEKYKTVHVLFKQ